MTDLHALLQRIEAAEGPDREIDADIALLLDGAGTSPGFYQWRSMQPKGYDATPQEFAIKRAPLYTASINAAVSFCERVMPGCSWTACRLPADNSLAAKGPFYGCVEHDNAWALTHDASAPTPALALCAAVVKAEIARRGEKP